MRSLLLLLLSVVCAGDPALDELVRTYSYDGLGRLIRSTAPFPDPDLSEGELRTERFYYDGIRRIQEVVTTPLLDLQGAMMILEDEPAAEALQAEVEPGSLTAGGEESQLSGGGGEETYLEREYVWGPGDRGVDELFLQIDRMGEGWWVLQDGGGDVVAVCDLEGIDNSPRVCAQFTYDAYGSVFSADHLLPHAFVHAGHKGLFFDRLDVGVADSGGAETPRLGPFARLQGYARGRTYDPLYGRWKQQDPNASGIPVLADLVHHGGGINSSVAHFDLNDRAADGHNLYGYVQSGPWTRSDPLGLYTGEDLVEDAFDIMGFGVAGPGDILGSMAQALISGYSANQDWDASWAADWETGDDWHSRGDNSWVTHALFRGLVDAYSIGLPFSDLEFNPLTDLAQGGSRFRQTYIRVKGTVVNFTARLRIRVASGSYYVNIFKHPKYKYKFVIFPDTAIKDKITIRPRGNSEADIRAANKHRTGDPEYKWIINGVPHTWHHDNVRGRMYLVPSDLHNKVRPHTGGAKVWYD